MGNEHDKAVFRKRINMNNGIFGIIFISLICYIFGFWILVLKFGWLTCFGIFLVLSARGGEIGGLLLMQINNIKSEIIKLKEKLEIK